MVARRATLSSDSNRLGHDYRAGATALFGALAGDHGSMVFSPWALQAVLAMTYAGAQGDTALDMQHTLRWTQAPAELSAAHRTLSGIIATRVHDAGGVTLQTGTRVWPDRGHKVVPSFADAITQDFSAPVAPLDYHGQADDSRKAINAWISNQAAGKIADLLPDGSITQNRACVQTAALKLSAPWAGDFNVSGPAVFSSRAAGVSNPTMIATTDAFPYVRTAD